MQSDKHLILATVHPPPGRSLLLFAKVESCSCSDLKNFGTEQNMATGVVQQQGEVVK